MEIALLILSVVLIALVLLQSNKASDAGQIITGGNAELFQAQKERGAELFISRLTMAVGGIFMIIVDTLTRIIGKVEMPVSILTGFIGAPVFLLLICVKRKK